MTPLVLLINPETQHGGIETLMLRKARWYRANGYQPLVLAVFRGNLHEELLAAGAQVSYGYVPLGRGLSEQSPQIRAFSKATKRLIGRREVSFIETFGPASALLGEALGAELGVPCVAGAFHPEAYYVGGFNGTPLLRNFGRRGALYFMNAAVRAEHARRSASDLPEVYFPLMLEAQKPYLYKARRGGLALFSLGRLVGFKTYNLFMLDQVAALRERYPAISYTVIGSGPLEGAMRERIAALGLGDCVEMIPEWPYSRLSELIGRYDLHIGMGTTVIDLALYGMPSLVAVVDDREQKSPGFVHEDVGNTGETYGQRPRPVSELLEWFAGTDVAEREAMARAGIAAVKDQYDAAALMPRFVDFAKAAGVPDTLSEFRTVGVRDADYADYLYWRFRRDLYGVWKRYSSWQEARVRGGR